MLVHVNAVGIVVTVVTEIVVSHVTGGVNEKGFAPFCLVSETGVEPARPGF